MQADRTPDGDGRWFHETWYATLPMTPCHNLQHPNGPRKQGLTPSPADASRRNAEC